MQDTLLAIAGKPGLYKLVARGNGNLIVESIDANKRRIPAGARERVTSLSDVSMYTEADDVSLMEVFQNICNALNGAQTEFTHKTATEAQLVDFMDNIALPAWDRDRVHFSDIRKLIQWYNILAAAGYKDYYTPKAEETAEPAEAESAE